LCWPFAAAIGQVLSSEIGLFLTLHYKRKNYLIHAAYTLATKKHNKCSALERNSTRQVSP